MNECIEKYIEKASKNFNTISLERRQDLNEIADYIEGKLAEDSGVHLIFICTHNSRRSHISQLWSQVAAHYYHISNIYCYSGGTEATAFNPRAVKALGKAGFDITQADSSSNPVYHIAYASETEPVKAFSKKFSDPFNPQKSFVAIMTCSQANEACPFVPGAEMRFSIPYDDPKVVDDTPEEELEYDERCFQIASEMLFLFSLIS